MKPNIDTVIETLIFATLGENSTAKEKHLLRESLRNLVRIAKAEQVFEMKISVKRLTGAVTAQAGRRQAKIDRLTRNRGPVLQGQQHLEFDDDDMPFSPRSSFDTEGSE
jgi:hypothetical protein